MTVPSAVWILRTAAGWICSAGLPVTGFFQTIGRIWILDSSMGGKEERGSSRFDVYRPSPVGMARAGDIQMYLQVNRLVNWVYLEWR